MTNEEIIKWFKENPFYNKDHEPFNAAINALEKPDLIHCKDCKYYIFDHVPTCTKWGLYGSRTDEKGFCYKGEKK